mmetsp:Transcript_26587/g.82204  ORF Transcript_26587/g.82204 Transcript_26587/m.82204 type:complete len:221 (+) Transcript_26587:932-1594(+)
MPRRHPSSRTSGDPRPHPWTPLSPTLPHNQGRADRRITQSAHHPFSPLPATHGQRLVTSPMHAGPPPMSVALESPFTDTQRPAVSSASPNHRITPFTVAVTVSDLPGSLDQRNHQRRESPHHRQMGGLECSLKAKQAHGFSPFPSRPLNTSTTVPKKRPDSFLGLALAKPPHHTIRTDRPTAPPFLAARIAAPFQTCCRSSERSTFVVVKSTRVRERAQH